MTSGRRSRLLHCGVSRINISPRATRLPQRVFALLFEYFKVKEPDVDEHGYGITKDRRQTGIM